MNQEVLETKDTIQKRPRLGFLGLGWIGRNRMEAIINDGLALVSSIAEPSEDNARLALQSAGNAILAASLDELINNPEIDGIVIATPSALHARQSIEALSHGKAVFCQKPLGRTRQEVMDVVDASQKADKLLGVDLSYRYTKAVQAIHPLVATGELGNIFAVELTFHNAYGPDKPWFYDIEQSGGGCIMDLGVHLVDLSLWCLNFPKIVSVNSSLYYKGTKISSIDKQVEDFGCATLLTETGTTINLQCSWNLSAGQDAVISAVFYGTRGGAAFRNINGSFYDFVAEKYEGTQKIELTSPPDPWSGRAGVVWARQLSNNSGFDEKTGYEFVKTAEIIDRIYGR
jgi:predicted dehydrogenase